MEPRYRIVLPIVGVAVVIIIALLAFFVTRRLGGVRIFSRATPTPIASSRNLLSPTSSPTPRPTTRAGGVRSLTEIPRTGVQEATTVVYTVAIDDTGFRDTNVSVAANTKVVWLNLGTSDHSLVITGLPSGTINPGASFSYVFATKNVYTIVDPTTSAQATITVQ